MISPLIAASVSKLGTTIKGTAVFALLGAFSMQMVPPNPSTDLVTKAMENGGMLAIVVILLIWIKRDNDARVSESKKDLDDERQRSSLLISVIRENVTAMVTLQAASSSQEKATERLVATNGEVARHLAEFRLEHLERERHKVASQ